MCLFQQSKVMLVLWLSFWMKRKKDAYRTASGGGARIVDKFSETEKITQE
jgi:hypothetical protein